MTLPVPTRRLPSLRSRILLLALLVCVLLASALTGFFLLLRQTQSVLLAGTTSHLFNLAQAFAKDYLNATGASDAPARRALDAAAPTTPGLAGPGPLPPGPTADAPMRIFTYNAFRRDPGVEGGFYSLATGDLLGYAFPTNDGPGPKQDVPPRERPTILAIAQQAATTQQPAATTFRGQRDLILFQAIPLARGGRPIGSVWAMQRIHGADSARELQALLGLSCLALAAMTCVGVAFWITRNVQADVLTIQGRLQDLELDLTQPRRGEVSAAELDGIMRGIDRLGISLQQKITKERQLVEQLHHKERLASLGQVAAGVAHELRNPLATIRLRTQMSIRSRDTEQFDRSAKLILEEIDRLSFVLERLLTFAKPIQLTRQCLDPGAICADVVASLRPEAERASVKLLHSTASVGTIVADTLRLRQVLENLIRNGMESFDGLDEPQKQVSVTVNRTASEVSIIVEDNGAGVPENASAKLIEPFYTTKARGTGLGLSIANEIVRAHRGTIELTPRSPRGTRVELVLPIQPTSPDEADYESSASSHSGSQPRATA